MDSKSLDILSDKLNKLKNIIPEAFTDDKLDWEKLKAALSDDINFENERYNLNWAGKSDAFRALQQRTSATLRPVPEESFFSSSHSDSRQSGDKESQPSFSHNESGNIFIEGENLEVLKVLQKSYFGKIKMIYIDPPYNTGNDSFIYPDKFSESKDEYLKRIGDLSEEGYLLKEGFFRKNSKDGGHYHSNWLSMMYPRLYIARNLLRDDGVIFVSIDDNELHNLRMIMNEIFGEENWIGTMVWKNATDNNPTQIAIEHEYICVYAKNKNTCESEWKSSISDVKQVLIDIGNELIKKNKDLEKLQNTYNSWYKKNKKYLWPLDRYKYIDHGGVYIGSQSVHNPGKEGYRYDVLHPITKKPCKQPLMGYRFPPETMKELLDDKRILFGEDETKIIELKVYAKDYEEKLSSFMELDGRLGSYDLKELFPESVRLFNNPKPVRFISQFLPFVLKQNETILDFFAGSASTAQAVLELNKEDGGNRKFILVQLPEKISEDSEAYKAGYKTIADICKARIKKVIEKLSETAEDKNETNQEKDQTELELDKSNGHSEFISESPEMLNQVQHDAMMGFQVFKLYPSNFKHWRSDLIESGEDLDKMIDLFDSQLKPGAQELNMLYELMLKSGYSLADKVEHNEGFYLVANKLAVVLNKIDQNIIDEILISKPQTCIILDNLFADNDQLKTNTALQMKDAGVEMVVV